MNRRNLLNTGDMVIGKVITANQLGYVYDNPEHELTIGLTRFFLKSP